MTEFDAILQRTLDAATETMILMSGVLIVLVIVFTIRFIFVMKKLRTESMSNQDYDWLMKRKRTLIFSICEFMKREVMFTAIYGLKYYPLEEVRNVITSLAISADKDIQSAAKRTLGKL